MQVEHNGQQIDTEQAIHGEVELTDDEYKELVSSIKSGLGTFVKPPIVSDHIPHNPQIQ